MRLGNAFAHNSQLVWMSLIDNSLQHRVLLLENDTEVLRAPHVKQLHGPISPSRHKRIEVIVTVVDRVYWTLVMRLNLPGNTLVLNVPQSADPRDRS